MKIDNQRNTYRIWLSRLVMTIVFTIAIIVILFLPWFDKEEATITKYHHCLLDGVAEVARGAGLDEAGALAIYVPLIRQALTNAESMGIGEALTGPFVRGDVGTVRNHLAAMSRLAPGALEMYRATARRELQLAVARGAINEDQAAPLRAPGLFGAFFSWVVDTQQTMQRQLANGVKRLKTENAFAAAVAVSPMPSAPPSPEDHRKTPSRLPYAPGADAHICHL